MDSIKNGSHLALRERRGLVKHQPARTRPVEDAIEHQCVHVDIEVQRRAEALQDGDCPSAAVRHTGLARAGA